MLTAVDPAPEQTLIADDELLRQYQDGSAQAFEYIVRRHTDMVYAVCLRTLNSEEAAEDATQATFLLFTRRAATLSANHSLFGWLYLAARNTAREYRRSALRRSRHEHEAALAMQYNSKSDLWERIRPDLDSAVAALPVGQREAIVLRFFYGLSEVEAAREARCPETALRKRVERAVHRLRIHFGQRETSVPSVMLLALLSERGVQVAPTGLRNAIVNISLGKATASAASIGAADAVLKAMALAKAKAVAFMMAAVLAVGAPVAYVGVQALQASATTPAAQNKSQAASQQSAGDSPGVRNSGTAQIGRSQSSAALASFDFEDGRTLPEWVGTIEKCPDRDGRCLAAVLLPEHRLTRVQIGDNTNGLFTYVAGASLSFDYWTETDDVALSVFLWSRTQNASLGRHVIRNPVKRKWAHERVDLSTLESGGLHLHDHSVIVDVTIQTGEGGAAFYIDNVTVEAPRTSR